MKLVLFPIDAKKRFVSLGFHLLSGILLGHLFVFPVSADDYEVKVKPFIKRYCIECHGQNKMKGGVDFSSYNSVVEVLQDRILWINALDLVESEEMPEGSPFPTEDERQEFITWIDKTVTHADWHKYADAGRVSLSRLTKIEYNYAIRDVFGIDLQTGIFLGRDPEGSTGFSNDRNNLSFPRYALQDFVREAERAVGAIFSFQENPWAQSYVMKDEWEKSNDLAVFLHDDDVNIVLENDRKPFHFSAILPHGGLYEITIHASIFGGDPVSAMQVLVNGRLVDRLVLKGRDANTYKVTVNADMGFNAITMAFDPSWAPLLQPKHKPVAVPSELEAGIKELEAPVYSMPDRFLGDKKAKGIFLKLNTFLDKYFHNQQLTKLLIEMGAADFEENSFANFKANRGDYQRAGEQVAFLLGITNDQLLEQLNDELGFDLQDCIETSETYQELYRNTHPERLRRVAGKVLVDRVDISNHPNLPEVENFQWIFDQSKDIIGARFVLEKLAEKAWRRIPTESQMQTLLGVYQETKSLTGSHWEGLRDSIVGILISPSFLLQYVVGAENTVKTIGVDELAARLSFFLWLSIPDEMLRAMANTVNSENQSQWDQLLFHLIDNPKFVSFCETFTVQWLNLEVIEGPTDVVIEAMRREPALLLWQVFKENRSLLDLLDAKDTWVNDVLAHHYDIPGIVGPEMRPVALTNGQRGGLLTMGGILVANSERKRTSPVRRGAWIVETLLGDKLPLPPPSVPELRVQAKTRTVREELELHRKSAECSSCHNKIDPYGFVLEHYDYLGMWRDTDSGKPVDASTVLEDGTTIKDHLDFKQYLRNERSYDFVRNFAENILEFALGREMQDFDEALIQDILTQLEADDYRAQTLLKSIIRSDAFQKQNNTESNQ